MKRLKIYTDGACSGNPGAAGIGIVIKNGDSVLWRFSKSIGKATNNIAEYTAALYALQQALILNARHLTVYTDSELLHRQVKGSYKVRNPTIKYLFDLLMHLINGFDSVDLRYIPREQNKEADKLARKALRTEQAKVIASEVFSGEESPSSKG